MKFVIPRILPLVIIIGLSGVVSCDKDDPLVSKTCPPYDVIPHAPYEDPIWHPSGGLIGFNHKPIKEISYSNGYDCPHQATYVYEEDSVGFWLIDSNGTNMRRVLSYTLETPVWSPDGNWIAFDKNTQIFKMPFDGEKFDTTSIQQLTFEGRNFFPAWSPDGKWIAFDSNLDSETGLNFIWKMKNDGTNKIRIAFTPDKGETRMPSWSNDFRIVHQRYIDLDAPEICIMDSSGNNVIRLTNNFDFDSYPKTSPNLEITSYVSVSGSTGGIQLWAIKMSNGRFTRLTEEGAINFSWSPNNKIVYIKYDYSRIDREKGALWIMDSDGGNQRQLTFNNFKITN